MAVGLAAGDELDEDDGVEATAGTDDDGCPAVEAEGLAAGCDGIAAAEDKASGMMIVLFPRICPTKE